MEQKGTSLSSSTSLEISRALDEQSSSRIRVLDLDPESIVVKEAAPEFIKELPEEDALAERISLQDGLQISAESQPLVPPPPPWDEEGSALTSLVSEALRPLPELAVGVGVGYEDEDEDDGQETGEVLEELVELDPDELEELVETSSDVDAGASTDGLPVEIEIVDLEVELDAASEEVAKVAGPRRVEELDIDLGDLSQRRTPPRRLLHYLRDRFIDAPERVESALANYRGKYASVSDYVREVIAGESVSDWLRPYIDIDKLARDWRRAGIIWAIDDPGGNGEEPGLHVFLS